MNCPACQSVSTRVLDSRPTPHGEVRRRRRCNTCSQRFTTYERIDPMEDPLEVAVVGFVRGLAATPTIEEEPCPT